MIGACPLDCPDACSWIVTVDAHRQAVKLRGNPDHPHTRGELCQKVNPYLEYSADPARLLSPLRRSGPKGSGQFERVSWDQAIDEISLRWRTIIDESGAEAIWPFDGTGNVGYLQGCGHRHRLWNALGASRHRLSICSISGHVGIGYTSGSAAGFDPQDIQFARLILLWGTNTLVSNRHLWHFIELARADGATVVSIDPIANATAKRSDLHIALRPGTDGALALALCAALANEGADDEFLEACTLGWAQFTSSLPGDPLRWASDTCDVPVDDVRRLVDLVCDWRAGPMAIKLGQGMQRHAHGGQAARAISCLPALTGDYHRRGGGLVYSTSPAYRLNTFLASRHHLAGQRRELIMTRLADELANADPRVRSLMIMGANPVISNPDQQAVARELSNPALFTVVFDAFLTDTARFADIVLPSTLQTEHMEMTESFGHLYLNWNEPAVAPPGECLSKTELMRRLALHMGLDDPSLQASDLEIAGDLLDNDLWRSVGDPLAKLRSQGWLRIPDTEPYQPFAQRFATGSGKFEFISQRAAKDGHGLFANYRPAGEASETTGSDTSRVATFALLSPAGRNTVNSVFAGTSRVRARALAPAITICSADAEAQGLCDGMMVEVGNERGAFTARLTIDDAVRPGVAMCLKGQWLSAFESTTSLNATVAERDSDMGAGAVYHDNRVTILATGILSSSAASG